MTLRVHDDVAWVLVEISSDVVAMRLPGGDPVMLSGTGAALFLDIANGLDPTVESLRRWPEHADEIGRVAPGFIAELISLGLIIEVPDVAPRPRRLAFDDAVGAGAPAKAAPGDEPFRVMFVCTANICRSAYAEAVGRRDGSDGIAFSSAGTHALVGHAIDPPMAVTLTGGEASEHRARQLTAALMEDADLVITMAERHRSFILDEWPRQARKTFVIGQVARELERLPADVDLTRLVDHLWSHRSREADDDVVDPYGRGDAAAAACAATIDSRLAVILGALEDLRRGVGGPATGGSDA